MSQQHDQGQNLLLVDDEPNILKSLQRLLRHDGYTVYTACHGKQALEIMKSVPFQVVISDQRMPFMTGSEFLEQARKLQPEVFCMLLSGYADFDAVVNAINNGAIYKFLYKPWNDQEIRKQVKQAFYGYYLKLKAKDLDPLTGVLNRSAFLNKLSARADHQEFTLFYLNLDRFLNVNSAYGNERGDALLKQVGHRLKNWCHYNCGLISRFGGDEFTIAIPQTKARTVDEIAESLLEEFRKEFQIEENAFNIRASIGIAQSDNLETVNDVINASNNALRFAKKSGKNCYKVFDQSVDLFLKRDSEIERDLYTVLNTKQLFLQYQPLVDRYGALKGCEALLRWNHPKFGLLPPNNFIGLSEANDTICDIGTWCIEEATRYITKLNQHFKTSLYISVNISPKQILLTDIAEIMRYTLRKSNMNPDWLEVEVTESVVIKDPASCLKILREIDALGVKSVLDDFGTGYSSLSYLSHFPFKKFKVDRSFITDIANSQNALRMLKGILQMGKNLDMDITIEGVETVEQFQILQRYPCDFLQGFYFSKPLSADDFTLLVARIRDRKQHPSAAS